MSATPGPWSIGRTLLTRQTRQWSAEKMAHNDAWEARHVFANFRAKDEGCSRKLIARAETPEDARLIAAAPCLLDALRAWEHAFKGKTIEAHGLADTMNVGYAIEKTRAAIAKAEGQS